MGTQLNVNKCETCGGDISNTSIGHRCPISSMGTKSSEKVPQKLNKNLKRVYRDVARAFNDQQNKSLAQERRIEIAAIMAEAMAEAEVTDPCLFDAALTCYDAIALKGYAIVRFGKCDDK